MPRAFGDMAEIPGSIGKYRVLGLLGRGGMGAVYKAVDETIDRPVAIKLLLPTFNDQNALQRFFSEARANGKLQHPNIVTLYDLGDMDGCPYLVMEFLDGSSLDKIIASDEAISILDTIRIVRQVCSALHFAHEAAIVHRDVKPGNVVLMSNGHVKLVDFGIAKYGNERHTRTGMAVGSANYMSPEQIRSEGIDRRTDVYSTGVLIYELLTRQLPFAGADVVSTIHKVLHAPVPNLTDICPDAPPKLSDILCKTLAKDAAHRYQSAEELSDELFIVEETLQRSEVHSHLQSIKKAMAERNWALASERLSEAKRANVQDPEVRSLSREIRVHTSTLPAEEKLSQLVDLATEAEAQGRHEDQLRLCLSGLEIAPGNGTLKQLRDRSMSASQVARAGTTPVRSDRFSPPLENRDLTLISPKAAAFSGVPSRADRDTPSNSRDLLRFGSRRNHLVLPAIFAVTILLAGFVGRQVWLKHVHHGENVAPSPTIAARQPGAATPPDHSKPSSPSSDQARPSEAPGASDQSAEARSNPEPGPLPAAPPDAEQAAWRKLKGNPTLSGLDAFLAKYPNSSFRSQAEASRDNLAWSKAEQSGSEAALTEYLNRYPSGSNNAKAREALLHLDQQVVDSATDPRQLDPLLSKYPMGDMHTRILGRLDDLTWKDAVKDHSHIADYLKSFPEGKHAAEARSQLRDLTQKSSPVSPPETVTTKPLDVPQKTTSADDGLLIQRTLNSYEDAYNRQDVDGIQQFWPTIPVAAKKSMEDIFKKMKSVHLSNQVLSQTISGSSATLRVSQTLTFSTGGAPQSKSDKVTMELQKKGDSQWLIQAIH